MTPRKTVVLINGFAGNGKTYLANDLRQYLSAHKINWDMFAFADSLKDIAIDMVGLLLGRHIDLWTLNKMKNDGDHLISVSHEPIIALLVVNIVFLLMHLLTSSMPVTMVLGYNLFMLAYALIRSHRIQMRRVLQLLGTDILRQHLGSNIFSNFAAVRTRKSAGSVVIFHDCRFQNELDVFAGGEFNLILVQIHRDKPADLAPAHASENMDLRVGTVRTIHIDNDHGKKYAQGLKQVCDAILE